MEPFFMESRVRYYVYLSTAKVRQLGQQIEPPLRERLSLSLNIKVPFVEVGGGTVQATDNDFRMLRVVLAHLNKEGLIGPVESDAPYFAAQLPLRWAQAEGLTYFTGRAGDAVLCLGGSLHHLSQRAAGLPPNQVLGSTRVGMSEAIQRAFGDPDLHGDQEEGSMTHWATMAAALTRQPPQAMEFVARRIGSPEQAYFAANWKVNPEFHELTLRGGSVPLVLATPLYVAESD
jgi:hypothetical protein